MVGIIIINTANVFKISTLRFSGALMSGLYNLEHVSRLVAIVMFNFLYTATLSTYEGIVFLVSAAFYLPCVPLVW